MLYIVVLFNTIIMNFSTIFFIQIIVTLLITLYASYFDVKKHYVPDMLTYILVAFGLFSNLILSFISGNLKFILASSISMAITFSITYLLWRLKMWGGGDVKLFTGIAAVIPFGLNIDFLNIFPKLSVYPFAFSVVLNSILVSFPFLLIFVLHYIVKNNVFKRNIDVIANMANVRSLKFIIKSALNKNVKIYDLKEGNILNDYYFNDEKIIKLIEDVDGNLEVFESEADCEFKYYFKSLSAGGLTDKDVCLLKILNDQGILENEASVKISYPFTPSILAGLFIAVFFGDMIMLFAKNFALVVV